MLELRNIPLSVINRALDLYSVPREENVVFAWEALKLAKFTKDIHPDYPGITPFAQAIAEYLSLSGPWSEDDGEYAGQNGFTVFEGE